ncbi:hypothetical protein [Pseudonocardia parietis]|uniref:4-amino-4-deoxy-L-arabinose transferase-like glycosyltransferase n=1 Tax=Pseudonocardia parietis TaxID=570936 RepID=A0ABS4VQA2_9PSEU|nr:hypothetical protein [Pseudonocardia parietis]MBP2366100.1 hypothetical protein [Pseudonocardia parietis]
MSEHPPPRAPVLGGPGAVAAGSGLLSLLLGAGFVAVSLAYNHGNLVPPLDDVYIHLQYSRQFGLGEPLRYQPGAPVTTGASSLLYTALLGGAYAIGFGDRWLLGFAVGLGLLCVAAASALTALVGHRWGGRAAGAWAGALTALSGPLLWGGASGMEVGLLAALLIGTLALYLHERPRFRWTPVLGALLALTRPEGMIVAAALVAAMLWTSYRAGRLRSPATLLVPLPLLAFLGQLLIFRLATGTSQANGVLAKSWLHAGLLRQPLEIADHTLRNLQSLVGALAGLTGQDVVPPLTVVFTVLGLVALAVHHRERTLALCLGAALAAALLSISTLTTAQWQNLRYLQPFLPLVLLLGVLGVASVASALRSRAALHSLLTVALLFTLLVTPSWALRLGQQASAMREGPVSVAQWISGNVPPGDVVAINDAGAAAWFGGHRTVDLIGLTTNGMAAPSLNGPGTLYEAVRRLPPDDRPDWFAVFDRWGGVPLADLGRAAVLGAEPVITFQLAGPARPISPTAPQTCQIDRSCDRVSVWKADWSLDGSADLPDVAVPGRITDHLNVGDMADEAAHGWTPDPPVLGLQPASLLDRAVVDGRVVADSGRRVVGGETFTLRGLTPGRPVTLTGRLGSDTPLAGDRTRVVAVDVDGRASGSWTLPEGMPWRQASFTILGDRVTRDEITVTTRPEHPFLAPYPDYRSYGWWVSAGG